MKKQNLPNENKPRKSVWRDWTESLIIAAVLAIIVRIFIIEPYKIPTGSMRDTLLEGDIILVNKFIYGARIPFFGSRLPGIRNPQRGDVIVFIYPIDPKKNFVKRLVGLPGDTVEIKNGTIYINDKPLTGPAFNQRYYYNRSDFGGENQKVFVPDERYYVLGDNSASSQDSRYWGFVPKKNIVGEAMVVYWPLKRIRVIK